ncbi:MAG: metallophosphoesterase [Clostridia bacterium]|nr:metallophosphoesterase [Clostridia bacterium]
MKFLLFADWHHQPGLFPGRTLDDLRLIQRRAEEENCDFIIHAGDFCHGPTTIAHYVKEYNDFHIPSYHCLGNHDADNSTYEEAISAYNMPNGYYYFDCNGYRMIVVNTNYINENGKGVNYSMGNYFGKKPLDFVPPEELKWLRETIESSPYPCITISHSSFGRDADGVTNQMEVRKLFNEANAKKPHSVLMAINGHLHRDNIRILDNICYFDCNSAAFDWVDVPHDHYPKEETDRVHFMRNSIIFNDPLYAIVTIDGTTIDIKGTETTFYRGISREMTDNPRYDPMGMPCEPVIRSAHFTL